MEMDRNIQSSEKEKVEISALDGTEKFILVKKKKKRWNRRPLMEMNKNIQFSEKEEEKMETSALDGNGQKYFVQ